jgi:transcriptional regulator GlxA family with amidase domain
MTTTRVGIIAFDDAEVLDVMGPFEVFAVAGRISSPPAFEVAVVSDGDGRTVTLRHGLTVTTHESLTGVGELDVIVVAGGVITRAERNQRLLGWLRERAPRTPHLASICTGAFILAEAGVLSDQQVTTHWDDQAELARRFPALRVLPDRHWVDAGSLHTSGGISAGIDLSLHLVELLAGRELAERTARQMEYRFVD